MKNARSSLVPPALWLGVTLASGVLATVASVVGSTSAPLLVQVLFALVSLPVVLLVIFVAFGIRYGSEVSGILGRISRLWFPGVGLEAPQPQSEPAKAPEPGGALEKTPSSDEKTSMQLTQQLLIQQRMRVFWYLQYLSVFLVPTTQAVLAWLEQARREVRSDEFERAWGSALPTPEQRYGVIDALTRNYLVEQNGPLLGVTPWGRVFLAFRAGTWRPLRDYKGDGMPLE